MRFFGALATLVVALLLTMSSAMAASGDASGTIDSGGVTRTYLIHVPSTYDGRSAVPLVLVLHGGGGQPPGMVYISGMDDVSDRHGFIAVYPAGLDKHWKDGRTAALSNPDDVEFIDGLIRKLEADYRIDPKRVFATGISNGAIFSLRLACELGGEIAAVAPVAGSNPSTFKGDCSKSPVSVMMINGTADKLVPFNGGEVAPGFFGAAHGDVVPVHQTISYWVQADGCNRTPRTTSLPDVASSDGTTTVVQSFAGCRGQAAVELYTVNGGGHTWPGGPQYLPAFIVGVTSRDFNASETMWQFFAAHPRQ